MCYFSHPFLCKPDEVTEDNLFSYRKVCIFFSVFTPIVLKEGGGGEGGGEGEGYKKESTPNYFMEWCVLPDYKKGT